MNETVHYESRTLVINMMPIIKANGSRDVAELSSVVCSLDSLFGVVVTILHSSLVVEGRAVGVAGGAFTTWKLPAIAVLLKHPVEASLVSFLIVSLPQQICFQYLFSSSIFCAILALPISLNLCLFVIWLKGQPYQAFLVTYVKMSL